MTKEAAIAKIQSIIEECRHLSRARAVMHWDETTGVLPPEAGGTARGSTQAYLAEKAFTLMMSTEMKESLDVLTANQSELSEREAAMLRVFKRQYDKHRAVPPEEVAAFERLACEANAVWMKAKPQNDFDAVAPYYDKMFAYARKLASYFGYENHPYDALLDEYEEGLTVATLDEFFGAVRAEIAPLLAKIMAKGRQPDISFLQKNFPAGKQELLGKAMGGVIGFDFRRGTLSTTEHPFMLFVDRDDVRFTTHYYENDLLSSLFSVLHEAGHGIYEQNIDTALAPYGLDEAASVSFHESQSRAYENIFGRDRAFMEPLLLRLKTIFPDEFSDVGADELYRAVNVAQPSLIRIEADELTYCLHILIRYELERDIMEDKIKAADLPRLWSEKTQELLGLTPPDNARGCMQDTHWSSGLFGYFPSYALGNAYGAQLAAVMKKSVDISGCLSKGDLQPITEWMTKNVHSQGSLYTPSELIVKATGEPLNPSYYTDYLKEKFTAIYEL